MVVSIQHIRPSVYLNVCGMVTDKLFADKVRVWINIPWTPLFYTCQF